MGSVTLDSTKLSNMFNDSKRSMDVRGHPISNEISPFGIQMNINVDNN